MVPPWHTQFFGCLKQWLRGADNKTKEGNYARVCVQASVGSGEKSRAFSPYISLKSDKQVEKQWTTSLNDA